MFPSGMQKLLWDSWVGLESRQHPGYRLYGSKYGNIYTYPYPYYEGGRNQRWNVYSYFSSSENRAIFQFKNVENGLILYSDGNTAYSSELPESGSWWNLVSRANGAYFCLENEHNRRVLDANEIEWKESTVYSYDGYNGLVFQHRIIH
jgi:hypothetical protein